MTTFSTLGALTGLAIGILLIILKSPPFYGLIVGAILGGLLGGGSLAATIAAMTEGTQSMASPILLILTSGALVGAVIKTGATDKIADTIVRTFGTSHALSAIAIATTFICVAGVFVDIAFIAVAPVALAVGRKTNLNKESVLMAMLGGGKAGNLISPNPSTIAAAEAFDVELTSLIIKSFIPALAALIVTIFFAYLLSLKKSGQVIRSSDLEGMADRLPTFLQSIAGPVVTIGLLASRPLFGWQIDPIIALPVGGLVCIFATGRWRDIIEITSFGLKKVSKVAILFVGTGAVAGIVKASAFQHDFVTLLESADIFAFMIAPLSGLAFAGATASTTAGATLAAQTFSGTLLEQGVSGVYAAAMVNAGATALNSLPHGAFFLASAHATYMSFTKRVRLIPFEACVGLTSTLAVTLLYLFS